MSTDLSLRSGKKSIGKNSVPREIHSENKR
jgi:hypothetical protein